MRVIVHGGAGSSPATPEARQRVLDEAAATAASKEAPLAAVEQALRTLERDEQFNAGVGGAVQADGVVRVDAGVMTSSLDAGAVASLAGVVHPVTVARAVCEETPHVLLAGAAGERFADAVGVDTDRELLTETTSERFAAADPPDEYTRQLEWVRERFGDDAGGADPTAPTDHDTVGAVAGDGESFAAATSTGGRWFALAGRVGDVPQVGSGFYCSAAGGASATGAGEDIARVTLSRLAVEYLEDGADAQAAAEAAIAAFAEQTASTAGVIVLGERSIGSAYNSEAMQTAVVE